MAANADFKLGAHYLHLPEEMVVLLTQLKLDHQPMANTITRRLEMHLLMREGLDQNKENPKYMQ